MPTLTEGLATIDVTTPKIVSQQMEVFYNPLMKHNRDVSVLLLAARGLPVQVCDCLAGSGVRAIRFLKEIPELISHVTINDADEKTAASIGKNLQTNAIEFADLSRDRFLDLSLKREGPGRRVKSDGHPHAELPRVVVTRLDANMLLLGSNGYDYIDIDPFGSPNAFLDAAIRRLGRGGILAVTATDTSSLAGSYPRACKRKYWAVPCDGPRKHEVGLRILVRKVQLVASQHDKALTPVLVYNRDHYYRAYFRCEKRKQAADDLLKLHGAWEDEPNAGPLWLGRLAEIKIVEKMAAAISTTMHGTDAEKEAMTSFLSTILEENALGAGVTHYHFLNDLSRLAGRGVRKETLFEQLPGAIAPTHHTQNAVRSTMTAQEILQKIKK